MANILSDLTSLIKDLGYQVSSTVYKDSPPPKYVVLTPTRDEFWGYADNLPGFETQGADISLFSDANYMSDRDTISNSIVAAKYKVTNRQYMGLDNDAGLHHYVLSVEKIYRITSGW